MKTKNLLLSLIIVVSTTLISVQPALSWGQKGHDVVAYIAEKHLTKKAYKNVTRALNGRSMTYYSSWMDNIRNDESYKMTRTWHYANVDEGETYETMTKEERGDVLTATNMVLEALKNHKELDDSVETVYVRLLIHMIGDMHCPMHAGRLSDRGGNNFRIKWFNNPSNLHKIWDSSIIESSQKWGYIEWQENIDYLDEDERERIVSGTPHNWFTETVIIAKNLYAGAKEDANYSWDYMHENFDTLEQQLRNAGYRLAALLNEIYK